MLLVIGYGNDLRGDDAAGRLVAARIDRDAGHDVEVLSVHQLTPELAPRVAAARVVVFVDAYVAEPGAATQVTRVTADGQDSPLAHVGGPPSLLALAESVYGHRPDAWLVTAPALCFDYGADPSPTTAADLR